MKRLLAFVEAADEFFVIALVADALKSGFADVHGGEECGDQGGERDAVVCGPDFGASIGSAGDGNGDVFARIVHRKIVRL